jgi:hypothetical protein
MGSMAVPLPASSAPVWTGTDTYHIEQYILGPTVSGTGFSQKSYMRYMTVLDILLRLKTQTEMLNEEDISRMNYYKL